MVMNKCGKELIEKLNKHFHTDIPVTEENASDIDSLFSDISSGHGYGWCGDCDKRGGGGSRVPWEDLG